MSNGKDNLEAELRRVARIADLMCTAHAGLRDRYSRRALVLDLSILMISAWLLALAFIDPQINLSLTPRGINPQVWGGLLACGVFALSIIQLRVDWKGQASAHSSSLCGYAAVKRNAAALLASNSELDEKACRTVLSGYDSAGIISIPEREFLVQKRRHLVKIEVSKHLDEHPGAPVFWTKVLITMRDCFKRPKRRQ